MATEKEKNPKEVREAGTERTRPERKPPAPNESREGMPGYGQPPEEVREDKLPEQKW